MIFSNKQKINDERVENLYNKIYREAYVIGIVLAVISVIAKYVYYGLNLEHVLFEFAFIILTSVFFLIRSIYFGIYSDAIELHDKDKTIALPMNIKQMILAIIIGIAISLFFGLRSAFLYDSGGKQVEYFFLVFGASFMIYIPFLLLAILGIGYFAKKKSEEISRREEE